MQNKIKTLFKEARKGFFGCYSVCETMKDTKEGYFTDVGKLYISL